MQGARLSSTTEGKSGSELKGEEMYPKKDYCGDGVYVEVEAGRLKVTTDNGIEVTNEIYLEPETFAALRRYVDRVAEVNEKRLAVGLKPLRFGPVTPKIGKDGDNNDWGKHG